MIVMKKYIILAIITLIALSCEDVIEVELNEQDTDLYAVEAKITTTDEPFVYLTKGLPVSSEEGYQGISNALVTITDNAIPSNSIVLVEDTAKAGLYLVPEEAEYIGVEGREYTITIVTGNDELVASDVLYRVEEIDSITVWPSLRGNKEFLGVYTYGQETPGIGNFYKWDIYINDTLLYYAETMSIASDEFVDGNYVNELEIFTDFHDPKIPEDRKIKYGDRVRVEQTSISEFIYFYFYQLMNQSMSGFLFSVPTANIQGNFTCSNGKEVLGLFTANDISISNTVTIDDSIENQLED
jgi:hypothetical protein